MVWCGHTWTSGLNPASVSSSLGRPYPNFLAAPPPPWPCSPALLPCTGLGWVACRESVFACLAVSSHGGSRPNYRGLAGHHLDRRDETAGGQVRAACQPLSDDTIINGQQDPQLDPTVPGRSLPSLSPDFGDTVRLLEQTGKIRRENTWWAVGPPARGHMV